MKKRYVAISLIIIFMVNALLSSVSYADQSTGLTSSTDHSQVQTPEDIDRFLNEGSAVGGDKDAKREYGKDTVAVGTETERTTELSTEQGSFISTCIGNVIATFGKIVQIILSQAVGTSAESDERFTIENLVYGKYELFDINIFNTNTEHQYTSDINKKIKESVGIWYGTVRNIALVLSFVVLLYIAIRMAMSTISADKAKYKKMLISWFTGFILLFVLHYFIMILIYLSDFIVKLLSTLSVSAGTQFEIALANRIFIAKASGWDHILKAILYCILAVFQLKYFLFYIKRIISNAFLILIAPLVTVTYAIDKASDLKAQAFNAWRTELTINIFIQPMHALLFMIFMFSAGKIAELYPILAIIFIFGLSWAEKLLRTLFKLSGTSIGDVNKSLNISSLLS